MSLSWSQTRLIHQSLHDGISQFNQLSHDEMFVKTMIFILTPLHIHTLVYKFLHTGFPSYFAPYLSSYGSSHSTRHSQSGGNFLAIPKFCPSVHKSVKQFGNSFAFDAPTVWNALPDEICAFPSLASFGKQLKTYLHTKAYPP